ncbi:MAG: hypothetical protein ACK53T_07850 [Planctomycetota bacterium]|jgi:hypothetical protein
MPIAGRPTDLTYEAKIERVLNVINKLHSESDRHFIRTFIFDLGYQYIVKSKELDKFVRPEIEALDRRAITNILRDLGYDGF